MAGTLSGRTVAVLATDGVEQVEIEQPIAALREAGATVRVLSLKTGKIQAMNQDVEPGDKLSVDGAVSDAKASEFHALVLPGGTTNPDKLRQDEDAVGFVRAFVQAGKPVAAICHGPWMLVEAEAVRGKRMTSWPSLRTDLRNAGAEWVDETCVVDGTLVTSRNPKDLPAFCEAIVRVFAG